LIEGFTSPPTQYRLSGTFMVKTATTFR